MRAPIFHVDAFTATRFAGNPAAVVVLERYPDEPLMHAIATENNLSETAFLVPAGEDWRIRWFTPTVEVPLCGHATLASAWVVLERLQRERERVTFLTRESGPLHVRRQASAYAMDFPTRAASRIVAPAGLVAALGATPTEVLANAGNYVAVMESASVVRELSPDLAAIVRLDRSGVVVTAKGDGDYDCVSRYFAPQKGIAEDPVTGAAHCALTPYWTAKLGKPVLRAYQASPRGGVLLCRQDGDRVELAGSCVPYLEGQIEI
jgi:PhzF family phenazine biosynthesis protein